MELVELETLESTGNPGYMEILTQNKMALANLLGSPESLVRSPKLLLEPGEDTWPVILSPPRHRACA